MISKDVVILTIAEFEEAKNKAFQRGVERGKFESRSESNRSQNREPDDVPSRTGL
jgi:hypothetical protein